MQNLKTIPYQKGHVQKFLLLLHCLAALVMQLRQLVQFLSHNLPITAYKGAKLKK